MSRSVVFRVDAARAIGTGHVMRCLTLALELREQGAICRFVSRAHPGALLDLIRQRGFQATALPAADPSVCLPSSSDGPAHAAWLGAHWTTDVEQTQAALPEGGVDWLVTDHYAIDSHWERAMRSACDRIMVIDDLADRPHDCDLLLDQNLGSRAERYRERVGPDTQILAGSAYALLRREFMAQRADSLRQRGGRALRRLMISLGGVDEHNVTCAVLAAVREAELPADVEIDVVLGPHAPWVDEVRAAARSMPWPARVHVGTDEIATLMAASDLAIGAAGSTSWERCCLGLPALVVILAPNQQNSTKALLDAGCILDCFEPEALAKGLAQGLLAAQNREILQRVSAAAAATVDGHGARRVAAAMLEAA